MQHGTSTAAQAPPTRCPVCAAAGPLRPIHSVNGYTLCECPHCRVNVFTPFRSPGASWYESRSQDRFLSLEEKKLWNHNQFLRDRPGAGGRLLDLGCGTGWFLSRARAAGYRVTGIDFDDKAVKLGRQSYGLPSLHVGSPARFASRWEGAFDVVTAFEVIEHLDDPAGFVRLALRFLKSGGRLAVSVPNRERLINRDAWWDIPPFHLSKWNAESLRSLLERGGLRVEKIVAKSIDFPEIRETLSLFLQKRNFRTGIGQAVNRLRTDNNAGSRRVETAIRSVARLRETAISAMALPFLPLVALGFHRGSNLYAVARRS